VKITSGSQAIIPVLYGNDNLQETPINDHVGMDESNPFAGLSSIVNQRIGRYFAFSIRVAKGTITRVKGISLNNNVIMGVIHKLKSQFV